jgi:hypothetical protein
VLAGFTLNESTLANRDRQSQARESKSEVAIQRPENIKKISQGCSSDKLIGIIARLEFVPHNKTSPVQAAKINRFYCEMLSFTIALASATVKLAPVKH